MDGSKFPILYRCRVRRGVFKQGNLLIAVFPEDFGGQFNTLEFGYPC
jgi:hypothetical protein